DSLVPPPDSAPDDAGEPLRVAAAAASLSSEQRALTLAHRSLMPAPSVQVGIERSDPAEPSGTLLPTVGMWVALPFFNWNGGQIAQARAARDRAQADLDLTRREAAADLSRARRGLVAALTRLARDRRLLASADRVAGMSLRAYAEGAIPLANVLEAQRNAREALRRARRAGPDAGRTHFRRPRPACRRGRHADRVRARAVRRGGAERRHRARDRAAQLRPRGAARPGGHPAAEGLRPGRLRAG